MPREPHLLDQINVERDFPEELPIPGMLSANMVSWMMNELQNSRYAPGDAQIYRDGAKPEMVHEAFDLPGVFAKTSETAYLDGCDWPVVHSWTVPEGLRPGFYIVVSTLLRNRPRRRLDTRGYSTCVEMPWCHCAQLYLSVQIVDHGACRIQPTTSLNIIAEYWDETCRRDAVDMTPPLIFVPLYLAFGEFVSQSILWDQT